MEYGRNFLYGMEYGRNFLGMEWKKIVGMEYGKIVFHSIPLHALLVLTETFSSHLDKFPADCPEFELYWLLSNQSGILLRRD